MTTIKAIETHYKGYRFRSRLEARWAVLFSSIGIPWKYEPEGYDLNGIRYLPDFFLSSTPLWVEIKGVEPTANEREKASRLVESTGTSMFLVQGTPGEEMLYVIRPFFVLPAYKNTHKPPYPINWFIPDRRSEILTCWAEAFGCLTADIPLAYNAARAARFEHGETPR